MEKLITVAELQQRTYWLSQLRELHTGKIIKSLVDPANEYSDEMYGLLIEMPDKTKKQIWFLSDEEGNNAGRFQVSNVS